MLSDLLSIIYPETCLNCNETLISSENFICTSCKQDLPKTDDHTNPDNSLYQKFAYEKRVKSVSAYMYFNQGGIAQKMLHNLKYNGKSEIGNVLGRWYGAELTNLLNPDIIIPVPIHKSKYRKRGYNQSLKLAEGISESFPESRVESHLVLRIKKTGTQTKRGKLERWQNMTNVYSDVSEDLSGLSILVVDDVITTGATIGMLCDKLVEAKAEVIHVVCIARR